MKAKRVDREVLELIGELPHIGIEPGQNGESSGTDPNVHESVSVGVRNSRVTPVRIPEVLFHFFF